MHVKKWLRYTFIALLTGAGVWLVLTQKNDLMVTDMSWNLSCKDGTHGTFIGSSAIKIEGCEVTPAH